LTSNCAPLQTYHPKNHTCIFHAIYLCPPWEQIQLHVPISRRVGQPPRAILVRPRTVLAVTNVLLITSLFVDVNCTQYSQ